MTFSGVMKCSVLDDYRHWHISTKLHNGTSKKTTIFIFFTDTFIHTLQLSLPTYTVNSTTVSKNCVTATKLQYNLIFQRYVYFNGKLKFKQVVLIKQNTKIM